MSALAPESVQVEARSLYAVQNRVSTMEAQIAMVMSNQRKILDQQSSILKVLDALAGDGK